MNTYQLVVSWVGNSLPVLVILLGISYFPIRMFMEVVLDRCTWDKGKDNETKSRIVSVVFVGFLIFNLIHIIVHTGG